MSSENPRLPDDFEIRLNTSHSEDVLRKMGLLRTGERLSHIISTDPQRAAVMQAEVDRRLGAENSLCEDPHLESTNPDRWGICLHAGIIYSIFQPDLNVRSQADLNEVASKISIEHPKASFRSEGVRAIIRFALTQEIPISSFWEPGSILVLETILKRDAHSLTEPQVYRAVSILDQLPVMVKNLNSLAILLNLMVNSFHTRAASESKPQESLVNPDQILDTTTPAERSKASVKQLLERLMHNLNFFEAMLTPGTPEYQKAQAIRQRYAEFQSRKKAD